MDVLQGIWIAQGLGFGAQNAREVMLGYEEARLLPEQGLTKRQRQVLAGTAPEDYAPLLQRCRELGVEAVPFTDLRYPERLRHIPSAPPVLYCKGEVALLCHPLAIGMVGTRRPSAYGADCVRHIGRGLARSGALIISGLAAGLDSEAHKAALAEDRPTLACIAFGHDFCYPKANRALMDVIARNGLVVGEYPPGTEPEKSYFLQRNRLIAALSHGVMVSEARERSGTMSTVNFATEYGRDVFAVPGSIFSALSSGTNALVREGAYVATCAEDVFTVYGFEPEAAEQPGQPGPGGGLNGEADLSEEAAAVLRVLTSHPQALEAVCAACGCTIPAAMAALTELELAGLCEQQAGRRFIAKS